MCLRHNNFNTSKIVTGSELYEDCEWFIVSYGNLIFNCDCY